jgi:plasmid stabilization system protein ParE
MHGLQFTATAQQQFDAALDWYVTIQPALGLRFKQSAEHILERVQRNPRQFKLAIDPFRRVGIPHFPFEIFYALEDTTLVVYSVFHTSQDPAQWHTLLGH